MTIIIAVIFFLFLMIFRVPIAFVMIFSSAFYILVNHIPINIIAHKLSNSLNSFVLLAVPLFILSGNLMNVTGITKRIFVFADDLLGHIHGGIAHANVLASLIFAGMSGSAMADIGGLGAMEMKAMNERGFPKEFSIGITCASGLIGPIFPPSIPLIIYAAVAEVSGVSILLAGVFPGILMASYLMIYTYFVAKKKGFPKSHRKPFKVIFKSFLDAFPAILAPLILMGGLISGIFSVTETAAVVVAYSLLLGTLLYREVTLKMLIDSFLKSIEMTGVVLFLTSAGLLFSYIITLEKVSDVATNFLLGLSKNPFVLLFLVNILFLFIGCFMEVIEPILIFVPILLPPLIKAGVDPLHFGLIMVFNLVIGMLSPPVGMGLYVGSMIADLPVDKTFRAILPFYIPLLVALFTLTFIPQISLYLPKLIFP